MKCTVCQNNEATHAMDVVDKITIFYDFSKTGEVIVSDKGAYLCGETCYPDAVEVALKTASRDRPIEVLGGLQ